MGFFAQIGITVTPAEANALGAPIDTIATETTALVDLIPDLVTALDAEDWGTVATKGLEATVDVGQIIAAFDDLATAAQGLALPGAAQLAERIVNYLLGKYLDAIQGLNDVLEFLGFLDRQDFNFDSIDPLNPPFTIYSYDFGVIGEWLSDPAAKAQTLYGWGPGFDGQLLFPKLEKLLAFAGIPVIYDDTTTPRRLDVVVIELTPTPSGVAGLTIGLKSDIGSGPISVPLGPDATLEFDVEFNVPTGMQLVIGTDGTLTFTPPSVTTVSGGLSLQLILKRNPPEPFILFGVGGGSRIEFGDFTLGALAHMTMSGSSAVGDLDVRGTLNDGKIVIDATKGDGFLGKILPGTRIEADFSMLMGCPPSAASISAVAARWRSACRCTSRSVRSPSRPHAHRRPARWQDPRISVGADIRAEARAAFRRSSRTWASPPRSRFPPHNSGNLGAAQARHRLQAAQRGRLERAGGTDHRRWLPLPRLRQGRVHRRDRALVQGTLLAEGHRHHQHEDARRHAGLRAAASSSPPSSRRFSSDTASSLIGVGGLLGLNRSLDARSAAVRRAHRRA